MTTAHGEGVRASAWSDALSCSRPDIATLLDRLPAYAADEAQSGSDIVVQAVDVGPELDFGAVPERRLIQQPDRDRALELDIGLLLAGHRLVELVGNAFLCRDRVCERNCILDSNATVTAVPVGKREERLGRRIVKVDRLLVVHVELDQSKRVLWPRLLHVLAVIRPVFVLSKTG